MGRRWIGAPAALLLAALLLGGAAPQPGGLSRANMSAADRAYFDGVGFAGDCATVFHYRASEEPGTARGRATAQAREQMIDRVLSLEPKSSRAMVVARIEKAAKSARDDLLAGRTQPDAAMEAFAVCDEEFRLGLVAAWAIPTGPETREGAAFFATRDFAEMCAGAYRHIGQSGSTPLAQAATRAEAAATAELMRRGRRPWPEAVATASQRAAGFRSALADGRLSYGQLQQAVQLCDQKLGLAVDAHAKVEPKVCEAILLAGLERREAPLRGVPMDDARRLGEALQSRCSIARDMVGQLRAGKCGGDPMALGQQALAEDRSKLTRLNAATDQTLACEGD